MKNTFRLIVSLANCLIWIVVFIGAAADRTADYTGLIVFAGVMVVLNVPIAIHFFAWEIENEAGCNGRGGE